MSRRIIFVLFMGVLAPAIFIWLGTWQLHRMVWKQDILDGIDARLAAAPVDVPAVPDVLKDKYLQVTLRGVIEPRELHVLGFGKGGPGFRVITAMKLDDGRRILVDRGFIAENAKSDPRIGGETIAIGGMIWPNETDKYIAPPDMEKNIWFARNIPLMAQALQTEGIMVAIRESDHNEGITPQIVSTNISNRHLEYVLTWYSMAIIWFGMTGYLLWRIKHKTE